MEAMVSSPMPMAIGMAPRSSSSGTMDMKNTDRYLRNNDITTNKVTFYIFYHSFRPVAMVLQENSQIPHGTRGEWISGGFGFFDHNVAIHQVGFFQGALNGHLALHQ